jgi:membrane protease YdiL (CAAX protease family)
MSAPRERAAFPGPLQAALLVLLAALLSSLVAVSLLGFVTPTAALGIASVVGLGAAGALGAANVPPPHAERVGLRGLRARHLAPIALLLPIALVASEIDNEVQAFFPAPDAPVVVEQVLERVPTDTSLALAESLVVAVGLVPVVEEWFFRGVIQQGLVASLGAPAGVAGTALLFAIGHGGPGLSAQSLGALLAQAFALGLAFGLARHATGSILAPIALHVGVNGAGVLALAFPQALAIAGYNAPGAHTPLPWLLGALLSVAAGAWLLLRETPPAISRPAPGEDASGEPPAD